MGDIENLAILVPIEMEAFWNQVRLLIREELNYARNSKPNCDKAVEKSGLIYKPFYDMKEVRKLFSNVSRTTIYEWMKSGKLKGKKMRGKIYFLWSDIEEKLNEL